MELSKTSYVILGMLRLGRRTGYEIKSLVDVSTRHFWAASYGQIYPELKRLEDSGMITGEAEAQGGRQRRAFTLTPLGEEALEAWIASGGSLHIELRHEGMLRFFFADATGQDEQVELLNTIRREHEAVREQLTDIRGGAEAAHIERGERFPLMTVDFGIAYQDFIVNWCLDTERKISESPEKRS